MTSLVLISFNCHDFDLPLKSRRVIVELGFKLLISLTILSKLEIKWLRSELL